MSPSPAVTAQSSWDHEDLIARVIRALAAAHDAIDVLDTSESHEAGSDPAGLVRISEKIVAESAMLLLTVESIRHLDRRIDDRAAALAARLIPHARSEQILTAICLEPGLALERAVAHLILSRLGHPVPEIDVLLRDCLALAPEFGPERLPHRRLEQAWLRRLWPAIDPEYTPDANELGQSMLARPVDALAASRHDFYAWTHTLMYTTDLGSRAIVPPRPIEAIVADADAALAASLETDDCDLTAELLFTWTMLAQRPAWTPAAAFAFQAIASAEDRLGFLPGSQFVRLDHDARSGGEARRHHALRTSYHAIYVMGFLCATALQPGRTPPARVPERQHSAATARAFMKMLPADSAPAWRESFETLADGQQGALATFVLAAALRVARARGDLALLRSALETALLHNVLEGPAPRQAAALLRRSRQLGMAHAGLARGRACV